MTGKGTLYNRRTLLRRGLFGAGLLALGGSGLLAFRRGALVTLPAEGLKALSPRGFAVLEALARRMIPRREGFPSVEEIKVAHNADLILQKADPSVRKELSQLLALFENALANVLFGGRTLPFTLLDGDVQDAVLGEWRDSRFALRRTGYQALRSIVMAAYYASPKTWQAVGYPGPPQGFHQPDAEVWRGGDARRNGP